MSTELRDTTTTDTLLLILKVLLVYLLVVCCLPETETSPGCVLFSCTCSSDPRVSTELAVNLVMALFRTGIDSVRLLLLAASFILSRFIFLAIFSSFLVYGPNIFIVVPGSIVWIILSARRPNEASACQFAMTKKHACTTV